MAFAALKKVPRAQWAGILSSVSSYLLPSFDASKRRPSPIEQNILNEISANFGYKNGEIPDSIVPTVHRILFREIKAAVTSSSPSSIRERVGGRGLLSNAAYNIEFEPSFARSEKMGVSKAIAATALRRSVSFEHFFFAHSDDVVNDSYSMFLSPHPTLEATTILVLAGRRGVKLLIEAAFFVFHDRIAAGPADPPVMILKSFVDYYGCLMTVGDRTQKLFFHEPAKPDDLDFIRVEFDTVADTFMGITGDKGVLSIAVAFAINTDKYVADLISKRIKIDKDVFDLTKKS